MTSLNYYLVVLFSVCLNNYVYTCVLIKFILWVSSRSTNFKNMVMSFIMFDHRPIPSVSPLFRTTRFRQYHTSTLECPSSVVFLIYHQTLSSKRQPWKFSQSVNQKKKTLNLKGSRPILLGRLSETETTNEVIISKRDVYVWTECFLTKISTKKHTLSRLIGRVLHVLLI